MSSAAAEDNGEDTFDEGDDEWDQYTATRATAATSAQVTTVTDIPATSPETTGTDATDSTAQSDQEAGQTVFISESNGQRVTITASPDSTSTSTAKLSQSSPDSDKGLSSGEKSGIIVACLLLLLLIAAAAWFFRARRNRVRQKDSQHLLEQPSQVQSRLALPQNPSKYGQTGTGPLVSGGGQGQAEEFVAGRNMTELDAGIEPRVHEVNGGEEYPAELLGYVKQFEADGKPVSEMEGDNSRYMSYIPYRPGIARKPVRW